jgi:hypothetical protein
MRRRERDVVACTSRCCGFSQWICMFTSLGMETLGRSGCSRIDEEERGSRDRLERSEIACGRRFGPGVAHQEVRLQTATQNWSKEEGSVSFEASVVSFLFSC